MKKLLLICASIVLLTACGKDAEALRAERSELRKAISQLSNTLEEKQALADSLDIELNEKGLRLIGREPVYTLELVVRTDYISSEVSRALTKIDGTRITIHVDKATYRRAVVGHEIYRINGSMFNDATGLYFSVVNKYMN